MNIQMVDLKGQYDRVRDDINAAIQEVLDDTSFIRGPVVGDFECAMAGYLGGRYAHGVANGTDALQIAMMALGIGPGDEVITTAFTFIATAEAAALLGAVPVFADIDPRTYNLDPSRIEELVTPRTRAIVPVHLFGQPANMDPILDIARRHGLSVIEDNAQGIGSTYRGRTTGYIGDIGTFSFFPSKNLGCYGDGGAVTTNDSDLFEAVRKVANHGGTKKYHNEVVGVNSRLDTLQAAILLVKLRHLDEYIAARRWAAERYDAALSKVDGISIPYRDEESKHVFHQYTIRVSPDVEGGRDGLASHLKSENIPHAVYYPTALHQLPVFQDGHATCRTGDMTHTEQAAREVISLPMHTELTEAEIDYICESINAYVRTEQEAGT